MKKVASFRSAGTIWYGVGAITKIGEEGKRLGGTKALIFTDKGVASTGIIDEVKPWLNKAGIPVDVYDNVEPEPTVASFEQCLAVIKKEKYDLLIGIGGGSSLDITKLCSVMATNPGSVEEYFGTDLVVNRGLPKIAVPTTSGTGSEVTSIGILTKTEVDLKIGVVSPYCVPEVAIVDPQLTVGMPPKVTASTGVDALAHAIESYTSVNASEITEMLSLRAIELIANNLRTAYANGKDLEAREAMSLASLFAGLAFANAGCTAVHALSFPLGGKYKIPHGVANALLLPYVMKYNIIGNVTKFAIIANKLGQPIGSLSLREAAERSVEAVMSLIADLNLPKHLSEIGIKEDDIEFLAQGASTVTRLLVNNPRQLNLQDIIAIYKDAL
ncbi:1,3-propanediol dehydrogenase [Moorella humiferrea]|uniref:iron-containing alcohol dehydrogenase n=1 Tax=Neomoorella humiferrea TaxID=676965 RepID=UPI0030D3EBE4